VLLVVLVACSGGGAHTDPAAARAPAAPPVPTPAPAAAPVDADASQTLRWLIATIEAGGAVSDADLEARFDPSFLAQVPADKMRALLTELGGQLPPIVIAEEKVESPLALSAVIETKAGALRVTIGMTDASPRRVHTLFFKPASTAPVPATYDAVTDALEGAGAESQLSIVELKRGRCTAPVRQHDAARRMALGSTFKLWVLLALAEKVHGKVTWDTTIPVRDELKSLPSGVVQDLPAGTQLTLRELATKMISISDNTATDHLIEHVGRGAVERALRRAHHGKPAANIPFLTTREMFALKLASTAEERDAYRKAPVAAKRKLLASLRTKVLDVGMAAGWEAPRDLCEVYAALGKAAAWDPASELLRVLAVNPGVPIDKADWPYAGFKGGSEPGVINLSWLLRRADGRWFVVTITVNDRGKALDDGVIAAAAQGALALLGKER
jgi:beta-lactamase class A